MASGMWVNPDYKNPPVKVFPKGSKFNENFDSIFNDENDNMQCPECGQWNRCPTCTSMVCERCSADLAITEKDKMDDNPHREDHL